MRVKRAERVKVKGERERLGKNFRFKLWGNRFFISSQLPIFISSAIGILASSCQLKVLPWEVLHAIIDSSPKRFCFGDP